VERLKAAQRIEVATPRSRKNPTQASMSPCMLVSVSNTPPRVAEELSDSTYQPTALFF
jgi:hypothetical protein